MTWPDLFIHLTQIMATKSKDPSFKVGAVVVDDANSIVSMGYNGPPRNVNDADVPLDERPAKYPWIIHAEENAIYFGLEARGRLNGMTLFVNGRPCAACAARIVHVGIKHVMYDGSRLPRMCDAENWLTARRILVAGRVYFTDWSRLPLYLPERILQVGSRVVLRTEAGVECAAATFEPIAVSCGLRGTLGWINEVRIENDELVGTVEETLTR